MDREERKQFVQTHRTCIFGYNRRNDGPSMSVTYYLMDDPDTIIISTMAERGKAKAVVRDPKISLCVLDENWPPVLRSGISRRSHRRDDGIRSRAGHRFDDAALPSHGRQADVEVGAGRRRGNRAS